MGITPFILGAAAIGAGGSILAANTQADATQQAANTSAAASQQATQTQLQMYNQTRSDLQPFTQTGTSALSGLSQLLGPSGPISTLLGLGPNGAAGATAQLQNMPGYQFALQQGGQALDRSAASRGLLLSGGQLKDAQTFGQGLASQQYGTTLSQLGTYGNQIAGLVNTGENAAAQTGNAGSAAANSIGTSLLTGAGQQSTAIQNGGTAAASGIAGAANNIGTLLQNADIQAALNGTGSVPPVAVGPSPDGGIVYSDRRLKTDIKKIGKTSSGLAIYSFRMKGARGTKIGVMAQEVEKKAPEAVKHDAHGFKMVDYGKVSRLPAIKHSTPLKRAA